jgi:hypothetical protein
MSIALSSKTRIRDKVYYQTNTKNSSFTKMWALLKAKGIENNKYFLALKNKDLMHIDPYDEDLDRDDMVAVFNECRENIYYYLREVFRLPEGGSVQAIGGGIRFKLSRLNLAQIWASELNLNTYSIGPRQTGKTWGELGILSHRHQFVRGCAIIHFNKQQVDSNDNLYRLKSAIELLPRYLQHSADDNMTSSEKKKKKNNEKKIINTIGSSIVAMSSASSETKADNMARGKTAQIVWFDEIAFLFFNWKIYEAALPAFNKAKENAIKYELPYGVHITTTPGDLCCEHGAYAYKFMQSCVRFDEEMYDDDKNEYKKLTRRLTKGDNNGFLFIQFTYKELGYTDDWYFDCTKSLSTTQARREYLLDWINSSGLSPFEVDDLDLLSDMAKLKEGKRKEVKITKHFNLIVYDEYKGRLPVLISCDVSQGIGRDYSTMVIVNPETLMPMAIFKSNQISSTNFKKVIVKTITKFYPHCVLTVENNSIGRPLINELLETRVGRYIYRERKTRVVEQNVNNIVKRKKQTGFEFGHNVNSVSRTQMTNILETLVRYNKRLLALPEIVDEIKFLERKGGRITHSNSSHDDVIMAYLGALYVVKYGTNLKGKGIFWSVSEDNDDYVDFEDEDDYKMMNHMSMLQKHDHRNSFDDDEDDDEFESIYKNITTESRHMTASELRNLEENNLANEIIRRRGGDTGEDYFDDNISSISESTRKILLKGTSIHPEGNTDIEIFKRSINLLNDDDDDDLEDQEQEMRIRMTGRWI